MKRNKILTLMAAAMTMTACSVSDITDNIPGNGNSVRVESAKVTRASDTQEPETMTDDFYLINLTQKEKVDDRYDAVFTYNDGTYTSDADVMWCGSGKNNFVAYYPAETKSGQNLTPIADVNRFMIPQNQTNAQDSIADWMRATATASKTDHGGSLSLNFEHMLTQVTIVCDYSDYYDDGEDVTVKVNQIYTRTQYCEATTDDQGNVTITPYHSAKNGLDGIYVYCDATVNNDTKQASSTVIIAPGEYKAAHDESYLYSGLADAGMYVNGTWESNIDIDLPQDMTFEAGKHYTFNVVIKGHDKATISGVTVSDWKTDDINGGTANKIPYVTFTADAEQVFSMTTSDATANNAKDIIAKLEYSVGNGEWIKLTKDAEVTFGGDKGDLRLRGKAKNGTATGTVDYCIIKFKNNDVKVSCTGDIRTLQDYTDHERVSSSSVRFTGLFMECEALETAPELPAKSVDTEAYYQMFFKCTSLKTAPELPATTLASNCYTQMFQGCTALTTAPEELPATTLAPDCYYYMFQGCTALTTAPELPATTLASDCYYYMFSECTELTEAPQLPATELSRNCYKGMFNGCTKLTTAPVLPATTLASDCYYGMFNGCTALTSVTMLAPRINNPSNLSFWLNSAGTSASARTLTLYNEEVYNSLITDNKLPEIWQKDKATIKYENTATQ